MLVKYIYQPPGNDDFPNTMFGRIYSVLSIDFRPNEKYPRYLVKDQDYDSPVSIEGNRFEILNSKIPPDWELEVIDSKVLSIQPKEFSGDFWEKWDNNDTYTLYTLEEVIEKTEAFDQQIESQL